MKQPREFAEGLGIGAGLIVVLGAISILYAPDWIGIARPRLSVFRHARTRKPPLDSRSGDQKPALLPPDYLDLCRAAGL